MRTGRSAFAAALKPREPGSVNPGEAETCTTRRRAFSPYWSCFRRVAGSQVRSLPSASKSICARSAATSRCCRISASRSKPSAAGTADTGCGRGYRLPPLVFSDDEALALTLGLLSARRLGLVTNAATVEGALAKLDRVLAARRARPRVGGARDAHHRPGAQSAIPTTTTVMALGAAVHEARRVFMRYESATDEATERLVDPYGLVHMVSRWYAPGYLPSASELASLPARPDSRRRRCST